MCRLDTATKAWLLSSKIVGTEQIIWPVLQRGAEIWSYHVLHADADLAITVEGAVETHNIGRVAFVKHLQLPDNLISYGRFDLQVNQL